MSNTIRPAAVAGTFYPAEPLALQQMIDEFLHAVPAQTAAAPKAIIAPHAGYIYSGSVAASAYARLIPMRGRVRRVVLLGPSHRVYVNGLALTHATHYATPLGIIPIDLTAMQQLAALPHVSYQDNAHADEHSLEVHLPFLQTVLDQFTLVPMVVGEATPQQVAEALALVWGGDETVIVISSDLSHFHDYQTAQVLDQATSKAIEALAPERISYEDACGRNPVNGLLHLAKLKHLHATTIDLCNSGDTAGTHDRVVGYGAYVFN